MVKYYNAVEKQIILSVYGDEPSYELLDRTRSSPCRRKLIVALYSVSLSSVLYMCYVYELYLFQLQQGSGQEYSTIPVPIPNNLIGNTDNEFNYNLPGTTLDDVPNVSEELTCHLPVLDPFDKSIAKFMKPPTPLNCRVPETPKKSKRKEDPKLENFDLLFRMDINSNLILLEDLKAFGFESCCYKNYSRIDDYEVTESKWCNEIESPKMQIPAEHEFIEVYCLETPVILDGGPIKKKHYKLVDMFNTVPIKAELEERIQEIDKTQVSSVEENIEKLNIVILGLDAVAHMNFVRKMPKTYKYLTNELSAIGMDGYTKVGDNTFPNMAAALMGQTVDELKSFCWNGSKTQPFDDCPFIWKDYSAKGYRTSFAEDAPWMGIFHYMKYGFLEQPTDYYLRTLTFPLEANMGHSKRLNAKLCYGPRPAFLTLLENIMKMAISMGKDKKYFQFTWATSLFHDDLNNAALGDVPIQDTLQWMKDGGYLENTILVMMSDHGSPYGSILETYQGKVESRMPFLYFSFPKWFSEKYRSAVSNVKLNRNRLTTPFDLHETLLDLMNLESIEDGAIRGRHLKLRGLMKSENTVIPRGISLFIPIPLSRDCEAAGISEHFCVCHDMVAVSIKELWIKKAAVFVVDELNKMIVDFPQCSVLELQEVKSVQQMMPSQSKMKNTSGVKFTITLTTVPGNATFEATLKSQSGQFDEWKIAGDISRINLYGTQSRCVTDYNMKKYCFCK